jgi:hypothetical protein
MAGVMKELEQELARVQEYHNKLEDAYVCGLLKKAKKIIIKEDGAIQEMINQAKESIKIMEKEVENGKNRLKSF